MEISGVSDVFFTHGQRVEFQSQGDSRIWFRCTYIKRLEDVMSLVTDSSGKPPRQVRTERLRHSNAPPVAFPDVVA